MLMIILFLLLSLSYSSTIECYDVDIPSFETEKLYEDMKEEVKIDNIVDSLDILLTVKFSLPLSALVTLCKIETEHYKSVYDESPDKPPRNS